MTTAAAAAEADESPGWEEEAPGVTVFQFFNFSFFIYLLSFCTSRSGRCVDYLLFIRSYSGEYTYTSEIFRLLRRARSQGAAFRHFAPTLLCCRYVTCKMGR